MYISADDYHAFKLYRDIINEVFPELNLEYVEINNPRFELGYEAYLYTPETKALAQEMAGEMSKTTG